MLSGCLTVVVVNLECNNPKEIEILALEKSQTRRESKAKAQSLSKIFKTEMASPLRAGLDR